ncbi:uncharacterized protein LOC130677377 [Microplitis mediator]|uniref:uncharacterized protein LOC130677377 n=1 Tax=Microplitis mediator TaxID=375433 RepID=UPI0025545926|nr:uncharacterized protein LOC130677377 [Microplitis mediator]
MIFQTETDPKFLKSKTPFLFPKEKNFGKKKCTCACPDLREKIEKSQTISEIAESKQPYKEIEAVVNNSRLVLRVQKLVQVKDKDKDKDMEEKTSKSLIKNDKIPLDSNFTDKPTRLLFTEIKEENNENKRPIGSSENKNIYVLKIKKSESWSENINLEFRIPRS